VAATDIELFVTRGLGDNSYLIASGGEALLVDPQRDAGRFLDHAERLGWRIRGVLETHVHNDYVSGAHEAAAATGATLHVPAKGGYEFDHHPMAEGDEVAIGDIRVTAMETPGHTPEHLAYLVHGRSDPAGGSADVPEAVFTGGSLMVGSAGRTDLLGQEIADELTRAQYRSLARLAALPAEVSVLPTHGAGSFCGSSGTGGPRRSTIGQERMTNPAMFDQSVEAFVAQRLTGLFEYPKYYRYMAPINRAGPALLRDLPAPLRLDAPDVEARSAAGAWIVDARPSVDFAGAHIAGSVNIELDDSFASYVGWIVPWGGSIVLVLPGDGAAPEADALEEATTQLCRIGWDRIEGFLGGGLDAWAAAGRATTSYRTAEVADVCEALASGLLPDILDVRQPNEWAEGTIPGSRTIFVGDLRDRVGEVPADGEVWTACRSGHRAAIAASLLDREGVVVRVVLGGGIPDVLASCPP